MEKRELIEANPLLSLGQEMFDRTAGMCVIGPGPGGIGVANEKDSEIGLLLKFHPEAVKENEIFPQTILEYEVSVVAVQNTDFHELTVEELQRNLQEKKGTLTQLVAAAALSFTGHFVRVSRADCLEAYEALCEADFSPKERLESSDRQEIYGPTMA